MSLRTKRGRICVNTQKLRLLAEVRRLCGILDRPVCSKDLEKVFRVNPERQLLLLQPLGQVLVKAARPLPVPAPYLHRIGVFGNVAFYAPDDDLSWFTKLDSHLLKLRVARAVQEQFPARAGILLDSPFQAIAQNALAGFIREWKPLQLRERLSDRVLLSRIKTLLEQATKCASAVFYKQSPRDFIDRTRAAALLRNEYATRNSDVAPERHNVNRHLSILKWPQSSIFAGDHVGLFSTLQLRCYAAARWPRCIKEFELAASLRVCLRYGIGRSELRGDTLKGLLA
jgi:hypothetical protein